MEATGPGCPGLGELGGLPTQAIGASIKDESPARSLLGRKDGASIRSRACKTAWPVTKRWAASTAALGTTRFTMNSSLAVVRVVGLGVSLLVCVESGPPAPDEEHIFFSQLTVQFLCQAISALSNCEAIVELSQLLPSFSINAVCWVCWPSAAAHILWAVLPFQAAAFSEGG